MTDETKGILKDCLGKWQESSLDAVVNRLISSEAKQAIADGKAAIALMQAQPSLIRRPVVEFADGELVVGLDTEAFERHCHG